MPGPVGRDLAINALKQAVVGTRSEPAFGRMKEAIPAEGIERGALMRLVDENVKGKEARALKGKLAGILQKSGEKEMRTTSEKDDVVRALLAHVQVAYAEDQWDGVMRERSELLERLWDNPDFRKFRASAPAYEVALAVSHLRLAVAYCDEAETKLVIAYLLSKSDFSGAIKNLDDAANNIYAFEENIGAYVKLAASTDDFGHSMDVIIEFARKNNVMPPVGPGIIHAVAGDSSKVSLALKMAWEEEDLSTLHSSSHAPRNSTERRISDSGNLKREVYEKSEEFRQKCSEKGISIDAFLSMNDSAKVKRLLLLVLEKDGQTADNINSRLNHMGVRADVRSIDNISLKVYADEIADAIYRTVSKKSRLREDAQIAAAMGEMGFFQDKKGPKLRFSPRDMDELRLGDRCGDCTAKGGINQGAPTAWLLNQGYIIAKVFTSTGRFAGKLNFIFGQVNEKGAIIVDAMEFDPATELDKDFDKDAREAVLFGLDSLAAKAQSADMLAYANAISNSSQAGALVEAHYEIKPIALDILSTRVESIAIARKLGIGTEKLNFHIQTCLDGGVSADRRSVQEFERAINLIGGSDSAVSEAFAEGDMGKAAAHLIKPEHRRALAATRFMKEHCRQCYEMNRVGFFDENYWQSEALPAISMFLERIAGERVSADGTLTNIQLFDLQSPKSKA